MGIYVDGIKNGGPSQPRDPGTTSPGIGENRGTDRIGRNGLSPDGRYSGARVGRPGEPEAAVGSGV